MGIVAALILPILMIAGFVALHFYFRHHIKRGQKMTELFDASLDKATESPESHPE